MTAALLFFTALFAVSTGVMVWYCRKMSQQLKFAVQNVDAYQVLLDQYLNSLKAIFKMDEYYGDDTIAVLIEHTKMVSEACKAFKYTILEVPYDQEATEPEAKSDATISSIPEKK